MLTLTQEQVEASLLSLRGSLLKKPYAAQWKETNPTFGYCYIVSEALYHFAEGTVKAYSINFGEEIGTHWFVRINDEIVDFTAKQFDFPVDYSLGVGRGFMKGGIQTPRGFISKRGFEMAQLLKLV